MDDVLDGLLLRLLRPLSEVLLVSSLQLASLVLSTVIVLGFFSSLSSVQATGRCSEGECSSFNLSVCKVPESGLILGCPSGSPGLPVELDTALSPLGMINFSQCDLSSLFVLFSCRSCFGSGLLRNLLS